MKKIITVLACIFTAAITSNATVYTDASEFPIYGKVSQMTNTPFERLPSALESVCRPDLWFLGRNSAGIYIRFRSNSTTVSAKWTSTFNVVMNHMTATGSKGLDLYAYDNGQWVFAGSGRPNVKENYSEAILVSNMDPEEREFMLYLSLYDGISSLEIGVDDGATLLQPKLDSPRSDKKIVMYGTSILQGGCVSRPGMAHTSIIGRKLDMEVINLGFSGNALLDMEIADLMSSVENPALFVLDYVPNASAEMINMHGEEFFRRIRCKHKDVPVIFIEDPTFTHSRFDNNIRNEIEKKNTAQKNLYLKLKRNGETNLYYIPTDKLIGNDGEACVDGIHFTDLGMERYVSAVYPVILKALRKKL